MNVNAPIHCWQVWEEQRYNYHTDDIGMPPNWQLIADPSDSMILGNVFGRLDIVEDKYAVVWDCWVPGTQFRNIRSGKIMEVYVETRETLISRGRVRTRKTLRWKEVKETDQLALNL